MPKKNLIEQLWGEPWGIEDCDRRIAGGNEGQLVNDDRAL